MASADPPARITLVTGGARSGKSSYAEGLAGQSDLDRIYVATGRAWDDEMRVRIERHREQRGDRWRTIEEPLELPRLLQREAGPDRMLLVDCLTLWITNLMMAERPVSEAADELIAALERADGPIVIVTNEVGMGIVPDNAMAREFRDHAGALAQRISRMADRVVLVAAGLPMILKG